jgi:hypothetical protein
MLSMSITTQPTAILPRPMTNSKGFRSFYQATKQSVIRKIRGRVVVKKLEGS